MTDSIRELSHQLPHRLRDQSVVAPPGRAPRPLYLAAAVRELDRRAIADGGIPGYTLMCRAAAVAWQTLLKRWPDVRRVIVVCGPGNNGGDGYEVARLAHAQGIDTCVLEPLQHQAKGDAQTARAAWLSAGGSIADAIPAQLQMNDVIVDALFGTGLARAPSAAALDAINWIKAARAQGSGVLAIDIPSGLQADSGAVLGAAVQADVTVTFIGRKPGLYTGQGAAFCGRVVFDGLEVPDSVYAAVPSVAELQQQRDLRDWLPPRQRTAHKGDSGHVLIVGGDHGTTGAVLLCARAALRAGAGLVSVATRREHAIALTAAQPELMCHGIESVDDLAPLVQRASVIAIGPGLGQHEWGRTLLAAVDASGKPQIADADALNLLARRPQTNAQRIITPHPGEAARLLGLDTQAVQADRIAATQALRQRYDGVVVLKGAGSLVGGERLQICPYGNPGMGVGGMGDALTGIIAAFVAQGLALETAANAGVLAHALAGDRAAGQGERGLLPSDLIEQLRVVVNP
ncbi:MAG: NAD(P)H-hydrate dehydratase [Nevskia sp.]|nr:NAD(P)H-hydrate dehydratase [Nevskia sp.]